MSPVPSSSVGRSRCLSIAAACSFAVSLLSIAGCAPAAVQPAGASLSEPVHGVTVTGLGEVKSRPDLAKVRLGIEVRSRASAEATAAATAKMSAIIAALKQQGIADADLQTTNYSVRFERDPVPYPPEPPRPATMPMGKPGSNPAGAASPPAAGAAPAAPAAPEAPSEPPGFFVVQNMVEVTVRRLDTLGTVLSSALGAGANDVWGIEFSVDKPEALQAQARQKALADARQKAETLAATAGVKLGKPVSISEAGGGGRPVPMAAMAKFEAAQSAVPVEGGEITVSEMVQVIYSIE